MIVTIYVLCNVFYIKWAINEFKKRMDMEKKFKNCKKKIEGTSHFNIASDILQTLTLQFGDLNFI